MELSAKYAYQVYKEKSFTVAAKALYVSQPALSATITKLEKEMGFRIFDRSKVPLSLTPQGEIYIQAIEDIIETESNMRQKIRELSDMQYGSLSIGGSTFTAYYLLTELCGAFYKKYPEIQVKLDIGNIGSYDILWNKLKNSEIDLLITHLSEHSRYIIEPIFQERLIIAMHKDMPGAAELAHLALTHKEIQAGDYLKKREIEDLSIFNNIRFIKYNGKYDIVRRMRQMLGDFKTAPYEIHNERHSEMHYNLMSVGIGAAITTDTAIRQKQFNTENILYFLPKSKESHRTIYIARQPHTEENPIVRNFMKIAKTYYDLKIYNKG